MKKILFGFAALAVLATSSCSKDDDGGSTGPSNRIVVAGETYAVNTFQMIGPLIVAGGSTGSNSASISFQFGASTATPSSGTYKLVGNADAADEVSLTIARSINGAVAAYASQDGSTVVTVGKDGDKTTVTMPEVDVKRMTGTGDETIKASANAKQL